MANDAVDQARVTNDRVSELSKAATRIGDVVEPVSYTHLTLPTIYSV